MTVEEKRARQRKYNARYRKTKKGRAVYNKCQRDLMRRRREAEASLEIESRKAEFAKVKVERELQAERQKEELAKFKHHNDFISSTLKRLTGESSPNNSPNQQEKKRLVLGQIFGL